VAPNAAAKRSLYVLDQEDLFVADIGLEIVYHDNRILAHCSTAVTGELNKGDFRWQFEIPDQIG
jgi:hypothetical protein